MTPRRFILPLLAAVVVATLSLPALASASHEQGGSITARITALGRLQGTVNYLTTGNCTLGAAASISGLTATNPTGASASIPASGTYTRCLPNSMTATAQFDVDLSTLFSGNTPDGAYLVTLSSCCRVTGIQNMTSTGTLFRAQVTKNGVSPSSAPVINSMVANTIPIGFDYKQNLNAFDPDGTALTYTSRAGLDNGPTTDIISLSASGLVSIPQATTTGLANNSFYVYTVRVTDASGDFSERDVLLKASSDNAPPSINGLTGSPFSATAGAGPQVVNFTADDPNNANPKIDTVALSLAGAPSWAVLSAPAGNPASAALTIDPPASVPAGTYGFNIDGVDSDTTSPLFASENVQVQVANALPATTLGTPRPDTLTASTSASLPFTSDDGTATFECSLDGGAWTACAAPKVYDGLGEGSHTFLVRAIDVALQADATPESYTWTIDATAPAAPKLDQAPSDVASSATFAFTPGSGETAECRIDDGAWAPCTSPLTPSGLADGTHTFGVRYVDTAGNRSAATSAAWTHDTTQPAAPTILAGPVDATTSRSASFEWSNEPSGSFECRLDGGAWAACASPFAATGLSAGKHSFEVRQTDAAGNVGAVRTVTWTVGEEPPASMPTAVETVLSQGANVTVQGDTATVGCKVTGGQLSKCLVDVYARVRARDDDINVATTKTAKASAAGDKLVLIGHGRVVSKAGAARMSVEIELNAIGRKLMEDSLAGVRVILKIEATTIQGPRLRTRKGARLVPQRQVIVPAEGLFESGKSRITPKAAKLLAKIADQLGKVKALRCIGHTDSIGSGSDNEVLGLARARAVCAALRAQGVKASTSVDSAGERHPRATNKTRKGRALNRRVEISVRYR